jgi:hypothetical protein
MAFDVAVNQSDLQSFLNGKDGQDNIEVILGWAGRRLEGKRMAPCLQVVASNHYLPACDLKKLAKYIDENYRAENAGKFAAVGTLISF